MKPKHLVKRGLALLLCASMLTCIFTGCSNKKTETQEDLSFTGLTYNSEGDYSMTITTDGEFSKNISVNDISISYWNYTDEDGYRKALSEKYSELADANSIVLSDEEMSKYAEKVSIDATDLKYNKNNEVSVSFKDKTGAQAYVGSYNVTVSDKKISKVAKTSGTAYVDANTKTLSAEQESVPLHNKSIRLTLKLEDGTFSDSISKEDITLGSSFEKMSVTSLSSAGSNLTLELSGDFTKNEAAGCYLPGSLSIAKTALIDSAADCTTNVAVSTDALYLDNTTVKFSDGVLTIDLHVDGYDFAESVNTEDVTIKDNEVVSVTKSSSSVAKLSIKSDAKDTESAMNAINGKEISVNGKAITTGETVTDTVATSSAGFYPVYDFGEVANGKCNITLMLYAYSGTFSDDISSKMVSYADDFKDSETVSLTRSSDTIAELKLSFATTETDISAISVDGTVNLSAGALKNEWGEATANEVSYSRTYDPASMGKDLSESDMKFITEAIGGFGVDTIDTVSALASGGLSVASGVINILEFAGVLKSEHAVLCEKLDNIYTEVIKVQNQLNEIQTEQYKQGKQKAYDKVTAFTDSLASMQNARSKVLTIFNTAKAQLKNEGVVAPDELTYQKDLNSNEVICTSTTAEQAAYNDYMCKLMERVTKLDTSGRVDDLDNRLTSLYSNVTYSNNKVTALDDYANYISYTFNYDTAAYQDRKNYETMIKSQFLPVVATLATYYRFKDGFVNDGAANDYYGDYAEIVKDVTKYGVVERTDNNVYCYTNNKLVYKGLIGLRDCYTLMYAFVNFEKDPYIPENPNILGMVGFSTGSDRSEFARRMNGRTLQAELDKAGFTDAYVLACSTKPALRNKTVFPSGMKLGEIIDGNTEYSTYLPTYTSFKEYTRIFVNAETTSMDYTWWNRVDYSWALCQMRVSSKEEKRVSNKDSGAMDRIKGRLASAKTNGQIETTYSACILSLYGNGKMDDMDFIEYYGKVSHGYPHCAVSMITAESAADYLLSENGMG